MAKKEPVAVAEKAQVSAATSAADKPMTAQELRELLAQSKDAQDDEDCLMCGS